MQELYLVYENEQRDGEYYGYNRTTNLCTCSTEELAKEAVKKRAAEYIEAYADTIKVTTLTKYGTSFDAILYRDEETDEDVEFHIYVERYPVDKLTWPDLSIV